MKRSLYVITIFVLSIFLVRQFHDPSDHSEMPLSVLFERDGNVFGSLHRMEHNEEAPWVFSKGDFSWLLSPQHPLVQQLSTFLERSAESNESPSSRGDIPDFDAHFSSRLRIQYAGEREDVWHVGPIASALGERLVFSSGEESAAETGTLLSDRSGFVSQLYDQPHPLGGFAVVEGSEREFLLTALTSIASSCFEGELTVGQFTKPWHAPAVEEILDTLSGAVFEGSIHRFEGKKIGDTLELRFASVSGINPVVIFEQSGQLFLAHSSLPDLWIPLRAPVGLREILRCDREPGAQPLFPGEFDIVEISVKTDREQFTITRDLEREEVWESHFPLDPFFVRQFVRDLQSLEVRDDGDCPTFMKGEWQYLRLRFQGGEEVRLLAVETELDELLLTIDDRRCFRAHSLQERRLFPAREQLELTEPYQP